MTNGAESSEVTVERDDVCLMLEHERRKVGVIGQVAGGADTVEELADESPMP
jgi:hypothetical protein